jgi:hypothetical protein
MLKFYKWVAVLLMTAGAALAQDFGDTPYVQTPMNVVERMLQIAKVNSRDYVIDLGSGDGRMVLTAAKKYGARGFGVDLDRRLVEASWCLGVSRGATILRVVLPACWPGIVTGLVMTFAHVVGEFGVVLMVGGNIPGITRTLSVALYDDVQALDHASAARTATVLVTVALVALVTVQRLARRPPHSSPPLAAPDR